MISKQDFDEKQEILITITISVGDEQILDTSAYSVDDAIDTLGKAERHYIPRSLEEQYNYEEETAREALELSTTE